MPNYTIQTPDRRAVRIPAPDLSSAMRAAESFMRGTTGYLTTAARAAPYLTEAGAGYSAGVRSLDDLLSGRAPDVGGNWTLARAEQQAVVDQFKREHPFLSNNATALGTVASMALAGLGLSRAARAATPLLLETASTAEADASGAAQSRAIRNIARNAFTGSGMGAIYGAAQPGTSRQRAQHALRSLAPGAVWGAGLPLGAGAAAALARTVAETAPGAGAVGSELVDTLRRATTGRTPVDQSRKISWLEEGRGEADAVRHLREMGVTPGALEQAQSAVGEKPITTAEAIGPDGITLAQGLRGRTGTTDAKANATLDRRAGLRPDRILTDASQAATAHPSAVLGDLDQLLEDVRVRAQPYMDEARRLPSPVDEGLNKLLDAPEVQDQYWDAADHVSQKGLKVEGFAPVLDKNGHLTYEKIPSIDFLDRIKNQLQSTLSKYDGSSSEHQNTRRIAEQLHTNLLGSFSSGEAYSKAHELGGDYSSVRAAWRNAHGRLLDPEVDPSSFENQFSTLRPFEKDAAATAGAAEIANLANQQPFSGDVVSDPAVLRKMGVLFGETGAQRLANAVTTEGAMANFEQPPPSGLAGLDLRLRATGQAPLNMAGRNALGNLLYQDPSATAQAIRAYAPPPNAFNAAGIRVPPTLQFGWSGLGGALQASRPATSPPSN